MTAQVYVPNLAVLRRATDAMVRLFERRKAEYQAFVEKRRGDLGDDRAAEEVFRKKKSCVPGTCRTTGGAA